MDVEKQVDKILDVLDSIPMNELVILTGQNGHGKSLIRKQMPFAVQKAFPKEITNKKLPRVCKSISMQLRTESRPEFGALSSMGHDWPLTPTSVSTYTLAKQLFKSLDDDKDKCYLIIDEPEIGMSRESQLAIAEFIKNKYLEYKNQLYGLLVITHSEMIVEYLKDISKFIYLDGNITADAWINRKIIPTDFETLDKESSELFVAIRDRSKPHKN